MYQALYRKYRPKDFDSVVGQDSIIKTLRNSIIYHNFSHAYMFFGPRGVGKTTISKIFARNINCLNPKNGIACEECDNCKISFSKDCIDILEIDAASNNGVDEIRELKSKISLVPSELKFKVYIIDEVHMLTDSSFNALLKTLEEPPEHAIFILATTDPQKVPDTIISRCQCFSFKRISSDVIKNRLSYVCQQEHIEIEEDVLLNISILSDGGMRDALGLLDKLTSYTNEKITMDDFIEVNGLISNQQIHSFLSSIFDADFSSVLCDINDFDNCGKNLIQIFIQILNYCRDLIIDYYLTNKDLDFSFDLLQKFGSLLNEKMFDIKKSDNTRIYIEMFVLKFINDFVLKKDATFSNKMDDIKESNATLNPNSSIDKSKKSDVSSNSNFDQDDDFDFSKEFSDDYDDDSDFIGKHSSDNKSNDDNKDNTINNQNFYDEQNLPKVSNILEINKVRINNTFVNANKSLLKEELNKFDLLKDYTFDQNIGYIVCSLLDSTLRVVSSDYMIVSYPYQSNVNQNLSILSKIEEVYFKITNSNKKIAIISDDEWDILKDEYISNLKSGKKYEILPEPEVILEDSNNNDIISNSAIELFGDIVEIE